MTAKQKCGPGVMARHFFRWVCINITKQVNQLARLPKLGSKRIKSLADEVNEAAATEMALAAWRRKGRCGNLRADKGKPTPTQEENDRAMAGDIMGTKVDGSEPDRMKSLVPLSTWKPSRAVATDPAGATGATARAGEADNLRDISGPAPALRRGRVLSKVSRRGPELLARGLRSLHVLWRARFVWATSLPISANWLPDGTATNWWQLGQIRFRTAHARRWWKPVWRRTRKPSRCAPAITGARSQSGRERVENSALSRILQKTSAHRRPATSVLNAVRDLYVEGTYAGAAQRSFRSQRVLMDRGCASRRWCRRPRRVLSAGGNAVVQQLMFDDYRCCAAA